MSENKYPNSGKLSANRYKDNPKKPDMVGELVMQRSALKELLMQHTDDDIAIKLSAWNMQGQYGQWVRLAWNNYKPKENGNVSMQQQRPMPMNDDSDVPF